MAVSTKMTVDVSGFKSGMQQAQASVKTLDAELKKNEAQFKATGNAEDYMAKKADILKQKLSTQKQAVDQAEKALNAMGKEVDKSSVEYQKMAQTLLNAQTAMLETQSALDGLSSSEKAAAEGANNLNQSVQSINKKVSLDQVISGINGITSVMEKAASVAVRLGDTIWSSIMDSAQLADEIATNAAIMGIDTTEYQQYKGVFDTFAEITVRDWMNAKRKIETAMVSPSNDQMDALKALGFGNYVDKYGVVRKREIADNWEDAMWQIAGEIKNRVENGTLSEGMADIYGMALFGKNYYSLAPLFEMGQEGFNAEKETIKAANEEAIKNEALLNDTVIKLTGTFEALKMQALGTLAPALTAAAEAIDGLLGKLLEYLQKPEGQEMLERLGTAVSGLFEDLGDIDPKQVVEGFVGVFTKVTEGVEWLWDHKEDVVNALKYIVEGWALLKLTGGALQIYNLINGITGLSATSAAAAGTSAGTSWASAFASAAMKAAPFLAFLYTMLKPGETGNNDLVDAEGNLTEEGKWFVKQNEAKQEALDSRTPRQVWFDEMNDKYNGTAGSWALWYNEFGANPYYTAIQNYWDKYRTGSAGAEDWSGIQELFRADENGTSWNNFVKVAKFMYGMDRATEDIPDEAFGFAEDFDEWLKEYEKGIPLEVDPEVPENAADMISNAIGTVMVRLQFGAGGGLLSTALGSVQGFANGLPWVNNDGLYLLHRGERVLTASQNRNYTYNSNNYFGNVNLNNGQDIEALCDSIDRHNRRRQSGFGE